MPDFPPFMRNAANRIASSSEHTRGIDGYVYDGADGSQICYWTASKDAETAEHVHPFDEWFMVIEGAYDLVIDGRDVKIRAGQEHVIPKGATIRGRVHAGTRTIHAFGGHRANRSSQKG